MTTTISVYVEIDDVNPQNSDKVCELFEDDGDIYDDGESGRVVARVFWNISGYRGKCPFAKRLAKDIWEANKGFCLISIWIHNMDWADVTFGEDDFTQIAADGM